MSGSSSILSKACKLAVAGAVFALPLGPFAWSEAWASDGGELKAMAAADDQASWSFEFPSRVALNQTLEITAKIAAPTSDSSKTDPGTSGSTGASASSNADGNASAEPSYSGLLQYEDYTAEATTKTLGGPVFAVKENGYYVIRFDIKVIPSTDTANGGWAEAQRTRFTLTIYNGSTAVSMEAHYVYIEPASRTVSFNTAVAAGDIDQPTLATKSIEATYGRQYSYDPAATDATARKLPVPTRPNYDFAGWYTSYDAKTGAYGQKVTEDTVFSNVSNTTLYAKWTGKKYEVLLLGDSRKDNRQGHIDTRSIYVTYGETYKDLAAVTGNGTTGKYTELRGWTDYDGNPVVSTDKVVDKDAEHRTWSYGTQLLYAVWGEARESIDDAVVSGIEASYPYKGKAITLPDLKVTLPELKDKDGNVTRAEKTLNAKTDYTVEYKDNVEITSASKKATFTVVGQGKYKGSVSGSFDITTGNPYFEVNGNDAINAQSFDFSFAGSGTMTIPSKLVTDAKDISYKLAEDVDGVALDAKTGTVTVTKPVSNVKVIATAPKGTMFDATPDDGVCYTFNVGATSIKDMSITASASNLAYSGKAQSPSITIKTPAGVTLKKGTDYNVKLLDSCKKVGTHKLRINGVGGYSDSIAVSFAINPKAPGKLKAKRYGSTKVKGKKYGLYTLSWGKVSGATKYQVYRTVAGKTAKSTFSAKTTSKKFGWQKGKKVTVKVRAYQTVSGKKYYSAWKTITVKAK